MRMIGHIKTVNKKSGAMLWCVDEYKNVTPRNVFTIQCSHALKFPLKKIDPLPVMLIDL